MKAITCSARLVRLTALLSVLAFGFSTVHAHTALKESTPANEATVATSPAEITLVFNGPVRLVKLELMGDEQEVATAFKPSAEAVASFVIATPEVADASDTARNYTVNWAAIGADGHTISNSFSFVVGAASDSAP